MQCGSTTLNPLYVFVQEDGEWKLIHGHTSIGVSNEEVLGEDISA
jgi:hypothetical protein